MTYIDEWEQDLLLKRGLLIPGEEKDDGDDSEEADDE